MLPNVKRHAGLHQQGLRALSHVSWRANQTASLASPHSQAIAVKVQKSFPCGATETSVSRRHGSVCRWRHGCHHWTGSGRKIPTRRISPWSAHLQKGIFPRLRDFALLLGRARWRMVPGVVVWAKCRPGTGMGILSLPGSTPTTEDWMAGPCCGSCGCNLDGSCGCAPSSATTPVLHSWIPEDR